MDGIFRGEPEPSKGPRNWFLGWFDVTIIGGLKLDPTYDLSDAMDGTLKAQHPVVEMLVDMRDWAWERINGTIYLNTTRFQEYLKTPAASCGPVEDSAQEIQTSGSLFF